MYRNWYIQCWGWYWCICMPIFARRTGCGMRVRARKVVLDGITFDSVHESEVYAHQLKPLARSGRIEQLQVHNKFVFVVNGAVVGTMKPDFTFVDKAGEFGDKGLLRCWDAKGFKKSKKTGKLLPRVDREFGIKKKLMRALFALEVECV